MTPKENRYAKSHEYIRVEGDVGTIGITNHAQEELGDVVFVELPEAGTKIAAGAEFGSIESVKAVSELFAPVSGEVLEVNAKLIGQPEVVNSDSYGEGWMLKVRLDAPGQLDDLMTAEQYDEYVTKESEG